jgi:hypothetical protein
MAGAGEWSANASPAKKKVPASNTVVVVSATPPADNLRDLAILIAPKR